MSDEQRARQKPGWVWAMALLAGALAPHPLNAQETVYIGGRQTAPAVEVDLSVLDGRAASRRSQPGLPDLLPPDPANGLKARAASSTRLTRPQAPAPVPAAVLTPSAQVKAPPPAASSALITPAPLSAGLTPAGPPAQLVAKPDLTAAAAPKPIVPALADTENTQAPPPFSAPQYTAALPAGLTPSVPPVPAAGATAAILFAPGAVELTPEAAVQLDALFASLTQKQRVQLKAHASGAQDDAGVRRIALKRALAARSHLLAGGMESTRIDVRALGPAADGGPDDRLDVIVVAQ